MLSLNVEVCIRRFGNIKDINGWSNLSLKKKSEGVALVRSLPIEVLPPETADWFAFSPRHHDALFSPKSLTIHFTTAPLS